MKCFRFIFGSDTPDNAMLGFTIREESEEKAVETVQKVVEALNCEGIDLGEIQVAMNGSTITLEDTTIYLPEPTNGYKVTTDRIEDEWEEE
jgi:hypothetical protein